MNEEILFRMQLIEKMLEFLLNDEQKEEIKQEKIEWYKRQLDKAKITAIKDIQIIY